MRNFWTLLARATRLTYSTPTGSTGAVEGLPTSNISVWHHSSTIDYASSSSSIEQRSVRTLSSSSQSWQYITRPQIKHAETSASIQGPGNQKAIVLAESTPTSECVPSTTFAELVTCMPVVDASNVNSAINCKTAYSETSGCNIDPSPSTASLTSTLTVRCDQGSCGQAGCGGTVTPAKPSGAKCKGCTTSNGFVHAPQSTVPASAPDPIAGAFPSVASTDGGNLTKRTLLGPGDYDDYDEFMLTELAEAREQDHVVAHRPPDTGGRSSARAFRFTRDAGNYAVERLSGCTVIIMVSRRGVWLSHHWEVPTFLNTKGPVIHVEQDVMVGMFTGDDSGWYPGLNEFTRAGDLFDYGRYGRTQNSFLPIIYTPDIDPSYYGPNWPAWKYLRDIKRIKELLERTHAVSVPVLTYEPIDAQPEQREEIFKNTARGKILVQYDPQNWLMTEKHKEGDNENVCYQQDAIVRIWDDSGKVIFEDRFIATPEQNALVNMQQHGKRSQENQIDWAQPYCGSPNTTSTTTSKSNTQSKTRSKAKSEQSKTTTTTYACSITSAPATTITAHTLGTETVAAQTISANTYCQCGKTIAGVETQTGSDGSMSLYCNNGGSASQTKPDKTLPPPKTCYVTSAPATTLPDKTIGSSVLHGQTIAANTYCQCEKTIAGVLTTTGIDGGQTYYCANGGAAATSAVTRSPPPTACKLTSAAATTWGSQTFPAETFCQCGDKVAGLDTSTGDDGGKTVFCADGSGTKASPIPITTVTPSCAVTGSSCTCNGKASGSVHSTVGSDGKQTYDCVVGSKTWAAASVGAPLATRLSKTCRVHLKEVARQDVTSNWPLIGGSGAELFVNEVSTWKQSFSGHFTDTYILRYTDTKMDRDVVINFGMTNTHEVPTINRVVGPPPADATTRYTKWLVFIGYGTTDHWATFFYAENNDTGQLRRPNTEAFPYCQVGAWDFGTQPHGALEDWIYPNRQMDCYFRC